MVSLCNFCDEDAPWSDNVDVELVKCSQCGEKIHDYCTQTYGVKQDIKVCFDCVDDYEEKSLVK